MRFRKILAALLASLVLVSAFSGCTSQKAPQASAAESQNQREKTDAKTDGEEPYTVHIMAIGDAKTEDCKEVSDYISSITEKLVGAKVQLTRGVTKEQLNLALTSGEKLDIFAAVSWYVSLSSLAASGQILPMTELLQQYGKETYSAISEADWKCAQIGSEIYGVPMNKDKAASRNFQMRKDIVEELSIDYKSISDFTQLEAVLKQVKAAKPDIYPIASASGSIDLPLPIDDLSDKLGVIENALGTDTTVVNLFETKSYQDFVSMLWKWNQDGLVMPDASSSTSSLEQTLGAGTGFGGFVPSKPGAALQASREAGVDLVQCQLVSPISTTTMVAQTYSIAANSENPEKATQVLNLMYTNPDISNAFVYGLEGKHYKYTDKENNVVDYADGITTANTGYSVLGWSWPNQQIGAIWNGDDLDIWNQLEKFNSNATPSPAKGFTWNNSTVLNEVTACQNVLTKYMNALGCGMVDPAETLPKFNQELKDAGIDIIIKEKQTQLDAYLAAQK